MLEGFTLIHFIKTTWNQMQGCFHSLKIKQDF